MLVIITVGHPCCHLHFDWLLQDKACREQWALKRLKMYLGSTTKKEAPREVILAACKYTGGQMAELGHSSLVVPNLLTPKMFTIFIVYWALTQPVIWDA